jgi:hypothetical protein
MVSDVKAYYCGCVFCECGVAMATAREVKKEQEEEQKWKYEK